MQYDRTGFAAASDGTRLFFGVRGHGPALVLDDGIGCDGWAWEHVQPHFAATHTVIHWHYRGHGRSGAPRDRGRIAITDLADDLVAVLDAAGVERAVHVGHSMGTQVCLETWRRHAARTTALVLVSGSYGRVTHTFHGSDTLDNVLPGIIDFVRKNKGLARGLWGRMPARLSFRMAKMLGEIDGLAMPEEDFVRYMEHLASMDPDLFLEMLERAGEHSAEDVLANIDIPVLVVAGERDTFTPATLSRFMAEHIPGAEYFELRGATHAAPIEQPTSLELRMEKFFRDRLMRAQLPASSIA
jgi:pimeloyl-ACP methyl ester carboxylesterase